MDKKTYNKSVDILLDSYNTGKLEHGNCTACACGNLLGTSVWAADGTTDGSKGIKNAGYIVKEVDTLLGKRLSWSISNCTEEDKIAVRALVDGVYESNGYTQEEIARIEDAFEMSISSRYTYYTITAPKEGQYIGLCAVLQLMETMVEEEVESGIGRLKVIARDKYAVTV